jgi:hypothetical protein
MAPTEVYTKTVQFTQKRSSLRKNGPVYTKTVRTNFGKESTMPSTVACCHDSTPSFVIFPPPLIVTVSMVIRRTHCHKRGEMCY